MSYTVCSQCGAVVAYSLDDQDVRVVCYVSHCGNCKDVIGVNPKKENQNG